MKLPVSCVSLLVACQFSSISTSARENPVTNEATLTKEEAREYFRIYSKLHPEKGDLYKQLVATFPHAKSFTTSQITFVTDPNVKKPIAYPVPPPQPRPEPDVYMSQVDTLSAAEAKRQMDLRDTVELGQQKSWYALITKYGEQQWYVQNQVDEFKKKQEDPKPVPKQIGPIPPGALTAKQAHDQLAAFEKSQLANNSSWKTLLREYGALDRYPPYAIRDVEDNGAKGGTQLAGRLTPDPVALEYKDPERVQPNTTFIGGFKSPMIRQSWRDVLYEEDPSQAGNDTKTIKDLVGATFSYAHDNVADFTTWSAVGAVIWPWQHDFDVESQWVPDTIVLAPSGTINRVSTNDPSKTASDSILFRVGSYLDWSFGTIPSSGFELRAAGVYATDTQAVANAPGYEVDLEPRWNVPFLRLGYTHVWIQKEPTKDPQGAGPIDDVILATKLRLWLHTEGGDAQDNGSSWDPVKGAFFRIGPTTQFQLTMPRVIFGKALSLTALYSYLAAISGSDAHQSFFTVSATYDLYKSDYPTENRKISLTAQYQKGGLNFTKEDVDSFTLGLGVVY